MLNHESIRNSISSKVLMQKSVGRNFLQYSAAIKYRVFGSTYVLTCAPTTLKPYPVLDEAFFESEQVWTLKTGTL